MTIGNALKELRKKQGFSQGELAKAAGISQTALSQIENGTRPHDQTLQDLSKALNVPVGLIHLLTVKKEDIPESKQILYDKLFPVIKSLVIEMTGV